MLAPNDLHTNLGISSLCSLKKEAIFSRITDLLIFFFCFCFLLSVGGSIQQASIPHQQARHLPHQLVGEGLHPQEE